MAQMTIFQVLEYGTPVYSDEDRGLLITWNGSATFNIWVTNCDDHHFTNTDCFTDDSAKDAPEPVAAACEIAARWIKANEEEL